MTNLEIINAINSAYQLPTDEQILQTLKAIMEPYDHWDLRVKYVKQHYYD